MKARAALLILAVGATPTTTALGQQDSQAPHVGFLQADARDPLFDAFRNGLHELGYVEGKTIVIEPRWADGRFDRLPALSEELVGLKVDVIVTSSTPATLAAKNATSSIPIVLAGSADPVETYACPSHGIPLHSPM
jgi:putative ABC transport system substrate-binding protein